MSTGVSAANVIDIVAHNAQEDVVILSMVEDRPWDGTKERLLQLQTKLNNYLSYALDGQLDKDYPDLSGKPVRIELHTNAEPDATTLGFLNQALPMLEAEGVKFRVVVP